MRVFTGLRDVRHPPRRAVVTIGVFDGVHLAHQRLIRTVVRRARQSRGTSVVITFDPNPQTVLDPVHAQPPLMPLSARLAQMEALGVEWVWVIPFTKRFARTSAEQFIQRLLVRRLRASLVVVGEAFAFGRDRRGSLEVLHAVGPRHGMRIIAVAPIIHRGWPVSSSRIRRLLVEGRLAHVARLLGRPPALYGTVIRGAGRGRRLGFPTANIQLSSGLLPPAGVYAVTVQRATRRWAGVMNLGVRPTFGPGPLVCEVHLLNFSGSLLGASVSLSLLARLRAERRFSSPISLGRQVVHDIARTRRLLTRLHVRSR